MQDFDNAVGRASKNIRMKDVADMVTWPEGDYGQFRMIGPLFSICNIWFKIRTPRKPEGTSIPKMCLDHDGATDELVSDVCPFRASGLGRVSREYYVNVIDRALQEDRDYPPLRNMTPEEYLGYKAYIMRIGDSRRTPVRLLAIPDSQIDKIKNMKKLNKVKDADGNVVTKGMLDPKYGCDIGLMYDSTKEGTAKYDVQKQDRTPITKEERYFGIYRADLLKPLRLEEAKREMEDLASKIVEKEDKGGKRGGVGKRREPDDPLMEDSSARMGERDLDEPRGKRGRDVYEDDAPRSARKSTRDPYGDEPRKRGGEDDEDLGALDEDFEKPRGRSRARDEDEPEEPRRRTRRDADDEEEAAPRRRASRDDDDEPRRDRSRGDRDERGGRQEPRDARGKSPRDRDFDDLPF